MNEIGPKVDAAPTYLEQYREAGRNFTLDTLERMLGPLQGDNRVARRKFKRLITKYWPLSPDPTRHPRLTIFVQKYQELESAK